LTSFAANLFNDNFSNARTPQNRDSYGSAEFGRVELLFEPAAIRLNGFQGNRGLAQSMLTVVNRLRHRTNLYG